MNSDTKKLRIFLWQGIDKNGMKIKGKSEASDQLSAISALKKADITVLKIKENSLHIKFNFHAITAENIASFTKALSSLISADIPLTTALEISQKNIDNPALKNIVSHISQQVNAGKSLSHAFRNHKLYFDDMFCSLIEAGERSGMLALMLKNITTYQTKSIKLKRMIKKALLYPMTVLIISLAVTIALLIFIVPQFAELFHNVGAELPILTQMIIIFSNAIYTNLKIIFCIFLFSFFAAKILLSRSEKCLDFLDKISLKIPLFGNILKQSILARSFHTLSVLLRADVPLTESLTLTAKISHNRTYKKAFADISKKVMAGNVIYASVKDTNKFPDTAIQMIAIGENTGTLDDMLEKIGEYFEERVDDIIYNIGQLLEPAIMIFLCIIVGIVVIAMYLPIFNIGTVI
jgi:type IV pilus assembly protein PilC